MVLSKDDDGGTSHRLGYSADGGKAQRSSHSADSDTGNMKCNADGTPDNMNCNFNNCLGNGLNCGSDETAIVGGKSTGGTNDIEDNNDREIHNEDSQEGWEEMSIDVDCGEGDSQPDFSWSGNFLEGDYATNENQARDYKPDEEFIPS